jgi:integrase
MTDLRICLRKKNFVIQDYDDGRKQIKDQNGNKLQFKYKKEAKAYAAELSGAVERKEIKLSGRHNFKNKFKEYAAFRLEMADLPGSRDTVQGVSGYKSYYDKYIEPYFPDVNLDEIDGPMLEQFVKALVDAGIPHKTNTRIIQHIHTFFRWCMFKKYQHEFSSALNWKIGKHGSSYLLPENDEDLQEKQTEVITPDEANSVLSYVEKHKDRSRDDAIAYGVFTMLACFGLRSSEIRGLKKTSFNFDNNTVSIKGAYHARTGYANRTKNIGSRRILDFTTSQSKHIKWFYDFMFNLRPHNKYFFAGSRGDGPISEYYSRRIIYKTYEAVGLAKLRWFTKANTSQYEILDCRFKDGPSKTWRHYNALLLVNNMQSLGLTPNYVKERVGHTRWTTTQDRYGNHNEQGSYELRQERAAKAEAALGLYNKS